MGEQIHNVLKLDFTVFNGTMINTCCQKNKINLHKSSINQKGEVVVVF